MSILVRLHDVLQLNLCADDFRHVRYIRLTGQKLTGTGRISVRLERNG